MSRYIPSDPIERAVWDYIESGGDDLIEMTLAEPVEKFAAECAQGWFADFDREVPPLQDIIDAIHSYREEHA